jgi:hypothetical protein
MHFRTLRMSSLGLILNFAAPSWNTPKFYENVIFCPSAFRVSGTGKDKAAKWRRANIHHKATSLAEPSETSSGQTGVWSVAKSDLGPICHVPSQQHDPNFPFLPTKVYWFHFHAYSIPLSVRPVFKFINIPRAFICSNSILKPKVIIASGLPAQYLHQNSIYN